MLHPDIQAEIILSFQEEKRQELARSREKRQSLAPVNRPRRARLMRASGAFLIAAGGALLRLSGASAVGEAERRLGEAA